MISNNKTSERIEILISKLILVSKNLDDIEKSLIDQLDNDEETAHHFLDKAVDAASIEYRLIGIELNDTGGFELMQLCYYKVPVEYDCGSVIEMAWNGIGTWRF
ncbi:hypothetical protein [Dyadobacter sp. 3J3]|uniref:hypothetical protein n=1 Tax=Dyadobacter sp. 3J3 TaxID=2606600 RepID=UPI00135A52A2|nr:hypothetical protein [Dyadobacter sp. 3J3]